MPNVPADVLPLSRYRHLRAARRHAEAVAAKLSTIPCEVHGEATIATCEVEVAGDGEIVTRMAQRPCCPVHAAALFAARVELDRLLVEESGLVAALVAADAD